MPRRAEDPALRRLVKDCGRADPGAFARASAPRARDRLRDHAPLRPPPRVRRSRGFSRGFLVSNQTVMFSYCWVSPHYSPKCQCEERPLAGLPAIELSNPRARPSDRSNPRVQHARPAFDRRALRAEIRGRLAFAARRSIAIDDARARRRQPLATPTRSRRNTRCHALVTSPGSRPRATPAFVISLARTGLARPEASRRRLTNTPGDLLA